MQKQPQADANHDVEKQAQQQRSAKLSEHVLRTLGHPNDLHRLQVRPLWKDRYRVNVLVGVDVVSAKVMHSYFVVSDDDGNIVTSNPTIIQVYRPGSLDQPPKT